MKKITKVLVLSLGIILSNISLALADGYGHTPVDTGFVLDSTTISALVALILFGIGALFIIEGKYFRDSSK
jgi:hypothetical protein